MGHVALASAISRLLLEDGHGPARPGPRVLPLRRRSRLRAPHGARPLRRVRSSTRQRTPTPSGSSPGRTEPRCRTRCGPRTSTSIRENLDRLEWHLQPLEDFLAEVGASAVDAFNLSDVFEYMSEQNAERVFGADRRERQAGRTPRVLEHACAAQPPRLAGRPYRVDAGALGPISSHRTRRTSTVRSWSKR